jgi:hypothetical protein
MESKKPFDQLYDPHKKAQDAIDHAREAREQKTADRKKTASEPHLIPDGRLRRCSVCGHPFGPDLNPSPVTAFAEHVRKEHRPTKKGASQGEFRKN